MAKEVMSKEENIGKEVTAVKETPKTEKEQKTSKAQKIRELYLQGLSYYAIAKQLGIRPQYSRNIILNAVEAASGHKDIKAEFERRKKAKQTKVEA